jgi:hypothetical protein
MTLFQRIVTVLEREVDSDQCFAEGEPELVTIIPREGDQSVLVALREGEGEDAKLTGCRIYVDDMTEEDLEELADLELAP